ncbi:FAD-dependent oxidoreductase [Mesorhizobium sp. B2-5-4]|nr:FAD-dependent oxidoreductase [Mesorhizobium sp. B2-5-4]
MPGRKPANGMMKGSDRFILIRPGFLSLASPGGRKRSDAPGRLKVQQSFGVKSPMAVPSRNRRAPPGNQQIPRQGSTAPDAEGVAPHHAVMKGLLAFCHRNQIEMRYRTKITGIVRTASRVTAVLVGERRIEAECVVACAGPNNRDIASLADVPLNGFGMRIEAMALEHLHKAGDRAHR